ncbi:MAG TPA: YidC/Oxa1 family insertase periplasmic-domain containing protein, partial [Gemmatimonadaceae bacterium]|nr:YidC/Oxa1 family insertase periplasmic-domain containing protein [Gemmatimonadaceae bacterium]
TVTTDLAVYRFSNIGAAPVSAEMRKYSSLRGGERGEAVELSRDGAPLLRYRLVVPGDTILLDRVPFRLSRGAAAADSAAGAPLVYDASVSGAQVRIAYSVVPESYQLRVQGSVSGLPGRAFLLVDMPTGLRSAEADLADDLRHYAVAYKPTGDDAKGIGFGKLDPGERQIVDRTLSWVAVKSKYFLVGLLSPEASPFVEVQVTGGPRTAKEATDAATTVVTPIKDGGFAFNVYAGPQEWRRLVAVGRDFENVNPYGGWLQGIVQPFSTLVMRVLLWLKDTTQLNYGWVLVIFGVAVRLIMWPLNQKAMRSTIKMQRLQPELQAVQKLYAKDPQRQQQEIMKVYKAHGMSPFSPLAGCLPMLIPMPVLFALFFVFQNTIEFRGVPFLWLTDISLKDPYYILPLLMGLTTFLVSWIGMRGTPPNPQAKMFTYVMPAALTLFLANMAAGLHIYYTVQNLAAIPQQWIIARERAKAAPPAGTPVVQGTPTPSGAKGAARKRA